MHDVNDMTLWIDRNRLLFVELFIGKRPTTNAEYRVGIQELSILVISFELHSVRVERKYNIWFPNNLCRSY